MTRTMNFNPGPACLPLPVLEEAQAEFTNFAGTGMSVLEVSHRSPEYDQVHQETQALMKELLGVGDDYHVLFLGGGASTQFAMIPSNFLKQGMTADYVNTGSWSKKAIKEGQIIGEHAGAKVNVAGTGEVDGKFVHIPRQDELKLTDGAAYVHITSNNTIAGTQWHSFPEVGAPLIADMSSDILWRPFDAKKFAMIYAGAQKNLGPSGVTVVVLRADMLERAQGGLPTMWTYKTHVDKSSLYNTPPCFPIYIVGKVLKWLKGKGGLAAMEKENRNKAELLYSTMDKHGGFFTSPVEKEARSYMNVVFRLPSEDLEKKFIAEGKERNMNGLKGHRSVGGIRFSIYNAISYEWVKAVADYMEDFVKKNG
jgi:phosphoserine aminotransferase